MSESNTSIGFGSNLGDSGVGIDRLTPEDQSPPIECVYDCIVFVIICGHKKMAVSVADRRGNRAVWLPFVVMSNSKKWKEITNEGIGLILNKEDPELDAKMASPHKVPIVESKNLQLLRLQIPDNRKFITRLTHFVRLEKSKEYKCCQNNDKKKSIQWIELSDAINATDGQLWGPEVQVFAKMFDKKKSMEIREQTIDEILALVPKSKSGDNSTDDELLVALHMDEKQLEIVYSDFLEHCFPALRMTLHSFREYLKKYEYNRDEQTFVKLFNAFDRKRTGSLDFTQLLLGLAAIEPSAPHKEARVGFVFRYYDVDKDEYLNENEFKEMLKEIAPKDSEKQLSERKKNAWKAMGAVDKRISLDSFTKAVAEQKFRGTSQLCRSPKPIVLKVVKSCSRSEQRLETQKNTKDSVKEAHKGIHKDKGTCGQCRTKEYGYGNHTVALDNNGRSVPSRTVLFENDKPRHSLRIHSFECVFNSRGIANVFIDLIREFNPNKGTTEETAGFLCEVDQRSRFVDYLKEFCSDLQTIFTTEERVIRLNSPVYVLGDLFANLDDLLAMESMMWNSFPLLSANYLFLGNYVDIGKWGIECVLYLFALKLIAPNKVILLRGKHEVRDVQTNSTFQRECTHKYGDKYGPIIWKQINDVFDSLPFAAVIDETIFCTHSGIPNTNKQILEFNKFSATLKNPSKESPLVWQLLCNEPTNQSMDSKNGFIENSGQGFGYLFNEVAVNVFLKSNDFTHIICGNRISPTGYVYFFSDAQFLTVFSNSGFKDNNISAAILLSNHKIQILRLDTTSKPSTK